MFTSPLHLLQAGLARLTMILLEAQQKFLEKGQSKIFALLQNIDYFVTGYELGFMHITKDEIADDEQEHSTNNVPLKDAPRPHKPTVNNQPTSQTIAYQEDQDFCKIKDNYQDFDRENLQPNWQVPKSTMRRRTHDRKSDYNIKYYNSFTPLQNLSQGSEDSVYRYSDNGLCDIGIAGQKVV